MKSSYKVAFGLTAVAGAWLLSGQLGIGKAQDGAAPASQEPQARELFAVRVAEMTAQPMTREVLVNGRTFANRSVELRAEIRGQVEEVLAQKGAFLDTGAPIVRIAVEARRADLEEAKANLALRKAEWEAAQRLADKGFNSEIRRAEAKARFEAAQAQLRQAEIALEKTTIAAPFEGILDRRDAEVGDYVDAKDTVATLVDLDPIKFVGFVTERDVADLRIGAPATARTVNGEEVDGRISFVAAQADEQARTFRVEVEAPNPDRSLVAGLTSTIRLPVAQKMAHKVSPAILTLDDDGTIGVKTLTADDVVQFQPVTILGSRPDGVWIGGLPDQVRIVVVGQEFIVPGEKVRAAPVDGGLS